MTERKRRPFRFILKLAVFAGILAAAGKYLVSKRDEYSGLTESEAKARMESKLAPRVGDEKASEIADQVVPVLRDRGLVQADAATAAKEAAKDAVENLTDAVGDAVDKAKDAVDELT